MAEDAIGLKFIIDEPAEVDFFDTHSPVATAISRAISENQQLKIIGLLGRWGSGKSTIVREVGEQLKKADKGFVIFTYDAWLHQTDPLRRSFLESLVSFLIDRTLIDAEIWNNKIKKLTGAIRETNRYDTPIVTGEAKLFFFLAAAFAIGLSYLSKDTLRDGIGSSQTDAGFATLVLGLILTMGPIALWTFRWLLKWEKSEQGERPSYLPGLIFNKNLGHVHSLTYQPLDSTSIEFGTEFRELMKAVKAGGRRLVIVIDNMDRVDEKEAMRIWANARSFFLSAHDDNHIEAEPYHPTVILPVDAESIEQMFAVDSDKDQGPRLARSFINKTFDVTFDVPSPVMSDWKRYLVDRMRRCLGPHFTEERAFRTRQFLETWFAKSKTPVTPREINKAINRIVALLMQWEDRDVTYESLAYYSINSESIGKNVTAEVTKGQHVLERFSSNWAREIAALYFGVSVVDAGQVLMTGPIQRAITEGNPKLIEPYRKVPGFGDIFEQVTSNLPAVGESATPIYVAVTNAGALLAAENGNEPWLAASWKNLAIAFNECEMNVPAAQLTNRLAPLLDHIAGEDAKSFSWKIMYLVDHKLSTSEVGKAPFEEIGQLGTRLIAYCERENIDQPWFDVDGDPPKYIRALAGMSGFPPVQARIRAKADSEDIVTEFIRRLNENDDPTSVAEVLPLLTRPENEDLLNKPLEKLEAIIAAADALARGHSGETQAFRGAIRILGAPIPHENLRHAAMERLVQENILLNQFSAVAQSGDVEATGIIAAALIWKAVDFGSPVGANWQIFLRDFPDIAPRINLLLNEIAKPRSKAPIDLLMKCFDDQFKPRDLIKALMVDRIERNAIGPLVTAQLLHSVPFYSRMIDSWTLREKFAVMVSGRRGFLDPLAGVAWNSGLYDTARLLTANGESEEFRARLIEKTNKATVDDWKKAVLDGAEPFRISTQFLSYSELKLGTGSPLQLALANSSVAAMTSSKHILARWFALADIMSKPGRRKVCKAAAGNLARVPPAKRLRFVKAGGKRFLDDAGISDDPEQAVEQLILPLARSIDGREWLAENSTTLRKTIERASKEKLETLRDLVADNLKSKKPESQNWAKAINRSWHLAL